MLTHRERLELCISGSPPDRVPVALWRHFPVDDQTPFDLARAAYAFQELFDFDLLKLTPASSYCLKDWGAMDEWRGASEGTRDYTHRIIQNPEDWLKLSVLDPSHGQLAEAIQSLEILRKQVQENTPIIQTIFNPLSQAKNLVGGNNLLVHIRRFPEALHAGLETITESTRRFIEKAVEMGVDGIFYAVQHAQYNLLTEDEYRSFGIHYDLQLLEQAGGLWLNMLHIHGIEVMFDLFSDYPVQIINWHDRETSPSLPGGLACFPGVVCGGVNRDTLTYGTAEQIRNEALEAVQATEGTRMILGTGCVTPIITPFGNILAVRQSVD